MHLRSLGVKFWGYSDEFRSIGKNVKTTENSVTKVTKVEYLLGQDKTIERFRVDLEWCFCNLQSL